jgi:hypothetical protein
MSGWIAGGGLKKPLNVLQQPILPDIKQSYPRFVNSGKFWQVDVGETLLGTETNTQLYSDAVLSRSYRENIDKYGQSSHKERITVFRPPLQSAYEDFEPLSRLPTKILTIVPRVNPGTTTDSGGTTAYAVNNQQQQEVTRFITDRINTESWHQTYYMPLDTTLDNVVLPDLVTMLPAYSLTSGFQALATIDAPKNDVIIEKNQPKMSTHSGYQTTFSMPLTEQTAIDMDLRDTTPITSMHSGYQSLYTSDGENRLNELELSNNLPMTSMSSGFQTPYNMDGETRLDELELQEQLTSRLQVMNPSSETGYKTVVESFTPPEDSIKMRQNPQVSKVANFNFNYRDDNYKTSKPSFQIKRIQPIKSYDLPLNTGTIQRKGIDEKKVGSRYIRNVSQPVY